MTPEQTVKGGLVAEAWEVYARDAFGGIVRLRRVREVQMKRAFYAGAQAAVMQIIKSLTPENEEQERDVDVFQDIHDELADFKDKVLKGEA